MITDHDDLSVSHRVTRDITPCHYILPLSTDDVMSGGDYIISLFHKSVYFNNSV